MLHNQFIIAIDQLRSKGPDCRNRSGGEMFGGGLCTHEKCLGGDCVLLRVISDFPQFGPTLSSSFFATKQPFPVFLILFKSS